MKNGYTKKSSSSIGLGKSTYGTSSKYRRRRNKRRVRNRIIIIAVAIVLLCAVITGIVFAVKAIGKTVSDNNKTTMPATQPATTVAESTTAVPTEPATENPYPASVIKDNNTDVTKQDDVYIWNNSAFTAFSGDQASAKAYADAVSNIKSKLGDSITVYNMLIPTHIEFGLPSRLKESAVSTNSQADFLKNVYSNYKSDVKAINCYNILAQKANDYTYFKTDDIWTGLGAYYAYSQFASAVGVTPVSLDKCTKNTIPSYRGYYANTLDSSSLWDNPDSIDYYVLPNQTSALITEENGKDATETTVFDESAQDDSVFIHGSNPLCVIKSDCNTGKKIAVIKEYYGNEFVPYLSANYDETHVIDYRKWSGDLKKYCADNGITEVLILNCTEFAANSERVSQLKEIVS